MRYSRVFIEAFGYTLPEEVVTTDALETRLAPAYERLRLPAGRLELMTGIRERRFYPRGTRPSQISIESGRRAMQAAGIDPGEIGALVHGSVCRDFLEPATACSVHHALGLPESCLIYDASNACLGILTGMLQVANMIELGQIRAGLIVGTEDGRPLVETTIERLNTDASIDRREIKQYVASLTIGSGSVAVLLCGETLSRPPAVSSTLRLRPEGNSGPNGKRRRLLGGAVVANTAEHSLCQSEGLETFMRTDSEQLMLAGVATGARTFELFLRELGWSRADVTKTICHQVGVAHRKLLFEKLGLSESLDFSTFETLGNTGAAALPLTMAIAAERGHIAAGDRVAMLGIGSGINCQMLGVEW